MATRIDDGIRKPKAPGLPMVSFTISWPSRSSSSARRAKAPRISYLTSWRCSDARRGGRRMVFFRLVSGFGTAQCSRLCAKRHESGRRDVAAAPKADEVIFEVGRVAGGDWAAGVAHVPPSSALQSGEARAAIVARLVGPHPLVDVAGQIEDAIAALAVGARAARHATVEPQQLGALDLRLFGVNAIEDRAHPLVVEVALLGLATPAGRKRRLLRTFASCDPLALTAHALALLGAAGFGVVEADHHRRLLTPTVRVLELV